MAKATAKLGISALVCVVLVAVGLGVGLGLGMSSPDESLPAANTKLTDFASTSDRLDCRGRSLTSSGRALKGQACDEATAEKFAVTLRALCDDLPARRLASTKGQSKPRRSLGAENTLSPTSQVVDRCTCAPTSAPRIVTPPPTFGIGADTLVPTTEKPTYLPTSGSTPTVSSDITGPPTLPLQVIAPVEAVAFVCPPPGLVGCTSPDPSNPEDECDAEGAPCDSVPGAFCCRDSCQRLYCTAKTAPADETTGELRRRLRRLAKTPPPQPTYLPTQSPVTPVPIPATPVPTYVPTICTESTPFPTTSAPVANAKPVPSVPPTAVPIVPLFPTASSTCPPCPEEVVTPSPTPQPVTPFPTTEFPTTQMPTDRPTDIPTSGSTPTVSTELTGPPTAAEREPKV